MTVAQELRVVWLVIVGVIIVLMIFAAVLALPELRRLKVWLRSRGEAASVPEGDDEGDTFRGPAGDYYDVDIVPGMRESRETLRAARQPDEPIDIANAAPMYGEDWQLWAEQCHSLAPLAQRVARIGEDYR